MYSEQFLERFWAKVDKTGECWLWTGAKSPQGYGHMAVNRKSTTASRISLEIHLGRPIADGMYVAHTPIICHNPLCVNPVHLREATPSENGMDKHLDNTILTGKNVFVSNRIFTEEQIKTIRADIRPQTIIAKEYNVCRTRISNIKTGKTYAWVL